MKNESQYIWYIVTGLIMSQQFVPSVILRCSHRHRWLVLNIHDMLDMGKKLLQVHLNFKLKLKLYVHQESFPIKMYILLIKLFCIRYCFNYRECKKQIISQGSVIGKLLRIWHKHSVNVTEQFANIFNDTIYFQYNPAAYGYLMSQIRELVPNLRVYIYAWNYEIGNLNLRDKHITVSISDELKSYFNYSELLWRGSCDSHSGCYEI